VFYWFIESPVQMVLAGSVNKLLIYYQGGGGLGLSDFQSLAVTLCWPASAT
jgi:hypothetical protein